MRIRKFPVLALLGLLAVLLGVNSCSDPEPAEISVRAFIDAKPTACIVQLFNDKGKQIKEDYTDNSGLVKLFPLPPGLYELRFKDHENTMYPAVEKVKLRAGGNEIVDVELNTAPVAEGAESSGS